MQDPLQKTKKAYPVTHSNFCVPVLVNRTRVIATAEDKANITGFRFTRPKVIPSGFVERRNTKGEFLDYKLIDLVTIQDVDGREKQTIKTSYYQADKRTLKDKPKPAIGEYDKRLSTRYHGTLSRNWYQEQLTLSQIFDELNAGYAIAPGLFNPPANKSKRTGKYIQHRHIILFDGEKWTDEHPAPRNLDGLVQRYPDIPNDFYWVAESINSRTQLKPELRTRLMLVLPEPIHKAQSELWQTVIDAVVAKYPFIDRGVGIDKVRLSFGNARPECENRVLGGVVSRDTFTQWQAIASEKAAETEALRIESEKQKAENKARRAEKNALQSKLKARGVYHTRKQRPAARVLRSQPGNVID